MKKIFVIFCALLAFAVFSLIFGISYTAAAVQSQTPARKPFTIRTDVTMVTTDVTVVGPDVDNLKAEDFVIYDNDVPHEVTHFSRNKLPLAIALLIDTSMSVEPYLPLIQVSANTALRRLNPDDMVVLYSFDRDSDRHSKLTHDRVEISKKISKLSFDYATEIYATISDAAKYLQKNAPNHRRAIIMISDNYHISNNVFQGLMGTGGMMGMGGNNIEAMVDQNQEDENADKTRVNALESAVTIFSIKTPSVGADSTGSVPRLKHIVSSTGGETLDIQNWSSLQAAMEEVMLKLRKQYTLGFNPTDLGEDGTFHRLEVKFAKQDRCSDCTILSRNGYYAGIASPVPKKEKDSKPPKYDQEETDKMLIQQSIYTAGTYTYNTRQYVAGSMNFGGPSAQDVLRNMYSSNLSGIGMNINIQPVVTEKGEKVLQVLVAIDAHGIRFQDVEDRHACKLHIGLFSFNEYVKPIGEEVRILEGQLKEDTYKTAMEHGILYEAIIPHKVDKQSVKVVVYDEYSDRVGSRFFELKPSGGNKVRPGGMRRKQ